MTFQVGNNYYLFFVNQFVKQDNGNGFIEF